MIVQVPNVLHAEQIRRCCEVMKSASWIDGRDRRPDPRRSRFSWRLFSRLYRFGDGVAAALFLAARARTSNHFTNFI